MYSAGNKDSDINNDCKINKRNVCKMCDFQMDYIQSVLTTKLIYVMLFNYMIEVIYPLIRVMLNLNILYYFLFLTRRPFFYMVVVIYCSPHLYFLYIFKTGLHLKEYNVCSTICIFTSAYRKIKKYLATHDTKLYYV